MDGGQGEQKQRPYKVDMDPDKALELVKHGASLILLNVPPYTTFDMDTQVCLSGIVVFIFYFNGFNYLHLVI